MKITIHIQRLILDGLPVESHERAHVQLALESELARLLTEGGLSHEWKRGGAVPRLEPVDTVMMPADRPSDVGHRIARAIHGRIGAGIGRTDSADGVRR